MINLSIDGNLVLSRGSRVTSSGGYFGGSVGAERTTSVDLGTILLNGSAQTKATANLPVVGGGHAPIS